MIISFLSGAGPRPAYDAEESSQGIKDRGDRRRTTDGWGSFLRLQIKVGEERIMDPLDKKKRGFGSVLEPADGFNVYFGLPAAALAVPSLFVNL
jgi:hypothetical protein